MTYCRSSASSIETLVQRLEQKRIEVEPDDDLAEVDREALAEFGENPFAVPQFVLLTILNLMASAHESAWTRGALKTVLVRRGCSEEQFEEALRLATSQYQETVAGTSLAKKA